MGQTFGHMPESGFNLYFHPEITPDPHKQASFDGNLGFEKGRKERVMVATPEELVSAKVALRDRDFCAHLLLKFKACRKDNFPFVVNCEHEKHAYLTCRHEDFIIRMKEYEREKRLMVRQEKIKKMEAAAA